MTRILLIRHAETEPMLQKLCGRLPGIALSDKGRHQARALAQALRREQIAATYSSPLERAVETAEYIGRHVHQHEGLNELDFGSWTGKPFTELQQHPLWEQYNRARSRVGPPGGEQPCSAATRAENALHSISAEHDGQTVAVITHADIIRSLLTRLLGMPLDFLLRLDVAPASLTEVWLGGAYPVVHRLNVTFGDAAWQ